MNNTKIYRTDVKSALVAMVWSVAFFTLVWINDGKSDGTPFPILLIVIVAALIFIVAGSEYYTINGDVLTRKQFYFLSKAINLNQIKAIRKDGYYRILPSVYPALHLIYDDQGLERIALLRYHSYGEKTLARFVNDLRSSNPGIEINDDVRQLIAAKHSAAD